MTFKQELIQAFWDMVNIDPDLSSVAKKAVLSRTTQESGWDANGDPFSPRTEAVNIKAIFDEYSVEQMTRGEAAVGDVKCLLPSMKLRLKPLQNDMVRVDATDYEVITVTSDAAGAGFTLQLRRKVI